MVFFIIITAFSAIRMFNFFLSK